MKSWRDVSLEILVDCPCASDLGRGQIVKGKIINGGDYHIYDEESKMYGYKIRKSQAKVVK